jgi:hypothetical protein
MHPVQAEASALPQASDRQKTKSRPQSAMKLHHAEALVEYIKDIFLDGSLLGEGIEPHWILGEHRSQNITTSA